MNPMIEAFIGVGAALYGGAMLAGVVVACQRPDAYRILTGEQFTSAVWQAGAVVSAIMVATGYASLVRGPGWGRVSLPSLGSCKGSAISGRPLCFCPLPASR